MGGGLTHLFFSPNRLCVVKMNDSGNNCDRERGIEINQKDKKESLMFSMKTGCDQSWMKDFEGLVQRMYIAYGCRQQKKRSRVSIRQSNADPHTDHLKSLAQEDFRMKMISACIWTLNKYDNFYSRKKKQTVYDHNWTIFLINKSEQSSSVHRET